MEGDKQPQSEGKVQNDRQEHNSPEDPEQQFQRKLLEVLEGLRQLPNPVPEMKLPEMNMDITGVYNKLCKSLKVPVNSTFLSCIESDEIDFSFHCLGSVGIVPVTKALIRSSTIKDLNLSYNNLGAKSLPAITLLVDRNENITTLNLSNNVIRKNSAKQLSDLISACSSVEVLDLSGNDLGDEEIIEIGTALMKTDTIKELNLSQNDISAACGTAFGSSISRCSSLELLDLSSNHFQDGAIGVFESLKRSNLKHLNFSKNGIPDDAMSALDASLRKNKSLQELDLSGNYLTNKGIVTLSPGLKRSSTLETLRLAHNPFQGPAANIVLSSVGENLKVLDLTGIKVNLAFMKTLNNVKSKRDVQVLFGTEVRYDSFSRDHNTPEDDTITDSNALEVLQKLADQKGVSLKNVLKSIHASFIVQKSEEPLEQRDDETDEKDKTREEVRQMTTDQFAKSLVNSQISVPKAVAQELAKSCGVDGNVNLWEIIPKVKWRPDDLTIQSKKKNEASPETKGKKKVEKPKGKKK